MKCFSKQIVSQISSNFFQRRNWIPVLRGFDLSPISWGRKSITTIVLLNGLLVEERVEEAIHIFDFVRGQNMVCCASFSILITELFVKRS
ncbi:hypothetical protein HHK36_023801 [Tetracentron sinense]|uniref:Uncharacterized protein n=1 Tax=Tetracentron sinense TaxID=13715 RepID=A0A834YQV8_TETSI|nr:hypothetical protein HHK36_023801 [Tetracentron sinense]